MIYRSDGSAPSAGELNLYAGMLDGGASGGCVLHRYTGGAHSRAWRRAAQYVA